MKKSGIMGIFVYTADLRVISTWNMKHQDKEQGLHTSAPCAGQIRDTIGVSLQTKPTNLHNATESTSLNGGTRTRLSNTILSLSIREWTHQAKGISRDTISSPPHAHSRYQINQSHMNRRACQPCQCILSAPRLASALRSWCGPGHHPSPESTDTHNAHTGICEKQPFSNQCLKQTAECWGHGATHSLSWIAWVESQLLYFRSSFLLRHILGSRRPWLKYLDP